jgi:hypothetical protein
MNNNISIYWDFENIHASICTIKNGPYWYRDNRFNKQPSVVDIKSIMEFARTVGNINANKAYGNWQWFTSYSFDLQDNSIDLIQLYPRGSHGKNGADIRLALDILEDINLNPHIDTIILVGGDSDYISVAQKVRQKGKLIIGIGVKETTNQYWVKSCNEFKYYSSLLIKSSTIDNVENEGYEESDIKEAKSLLKKAIEKIIETSSDGNAKKAALKPMIMRLDPSFDETNYGFKSFSDLLDNCSDIIEIKKGESDHIIILKQKNINNSQPSSSSTQLIDINQYERILKKQQIRLPSANLLKIGANKTFEIFSRHKTIESYKLFQEKLLAEMKAEEVGVTETDVSKIKAILYKAFLFRLDHESKSIKLNADAASAEIIFDRIIIMLTKRLLDNIDGKPDIEEFSKLLFGDTINFDLANDYINKYYKNTERTI